MLEIISNITQILLAFLIIIFGYFGFGLFLIKNIKLKFSSSEKFILATILGISLATTIVAFLGQFISIYAYYVLLPIFFIGATQFKTIFKIFIGFYRFFQKNLIGSFFILFSIFVFTTTIIFSHVRSDGSFVFQEIHDSVWHIALIQNLQKSIPPAHPSTDTIILNNYHYFYDLFLAGIAKFTTISDFILYYQVSVIFLSVILVGSAYVLGKNLKNAFSGYMLVGATIFIGSISYMIPLLFHPDQPWGESSFWVSQTLVMIVNPQVIYTLALTYLVIFLVNKLSSFSEINLKNKSDYLLLNSIIIVIVASSIGFKSYSWVILSVVYATFLLYEFFKHKSYLPIAIGIVYSVISLPIVWLITRFQGNSFFYEPLWYTNSMIESPDRVNYLEWKFLQDHYIFKKNWPRLILLETKKLLVFYFGNLGIRSLFFALPFLLIFKKRRENINWGLTSYLFIGFIFSSIFPLLFLQTGTVWNSIQFWYYSLIFANVLLVIFLSEIFTKKSLIFIIISLTLLISAAIPTSIKTIQDKNKNPFVLDSEIISALAEMKKSDSILVCPQGNQLYHSSLVKVLTSANVYLVNPSQIQLVGDNNLIAQDYEKLFDNTDVNGLKKLIKIQKTTVIICSDERLTKKIEEILSTQDNIISAHSVGSYNLINL